jgi:ABC-type transporter Mla subunit MlaD
MWTYLRLLTLETSLEQFLSSEGKEDIPRSIATNQAEIDQLDADIKTAVSKGETPTTKMRLMDSRKERLAALNKRQERVSEASDNLKLVSAEQDRLVDQIKLLRADSVAAKNAETLTARIDATVENLSQTNKLFSEMEQFKDLVSEDLPQTSERLGYAPVSPPPGGFRVIDQRASAQPPVAEPPPVIRVRPNVWTKR